MLWEAEAQKVAVGGEEAVLAHQPNGWQKDAHFGCFGHCSLKGPTRSAGMASGNSIFPATDQFAANAAQ